MAGRDSACTQHSRRADRHEKPGVMGHDGRESLRHAGPRVNGIGFSRSSSQGCAGRGKLEAPTRSGVHAGALRKDRRSLRWRYAVHHSGSLVYLSEQQAVVMAAVATCSVSARALLRAG